MNRGRGVTRSRCVRADSDMREGGYILIRVSWRLGIQSGLIGVGLDFVILRCSGRHVEGVFTGSCLHCIDMNRNAMGAGCWCGPVRTNRNMCVITGMGYAGTEANVSLELYDT